MKVYYIGHDYNWEMCPQQSYDAFQRNRNVNEIEKLMYRSRENAIKRLYEICRHQNELFAEDPEKRIGMFGQFKYGDWQVNEDLGIVHCTAHDVKYDDFFSCVCAWTEEHVLED